MKIAFFGSSLLSSYWNGAATYYRGLLRALANLGHEITFYEPDAFDRQQHKDIEPPAWCKVVVYQANSDGLKRAAMEAAKAEVVVKASGVGFRDEDLLAMVMAAAGDHALKIFWDVDAPATLAELRADRSHPLRRTLPELDAVMTYGGGQHVIEAYAALGARECVPIYNAFDSETHFPVAKDVRFEGDLAFLGNRLPDREARVDAFFFEPATRLPDRCFVLGGAGWRREALPPNVRYVGHVATPDHNAFNVSALAVINISRERMAKTGFSPATRVFEAAGAGACLITDAWDGIESFFAPGEEVLIARDGDDVASLLSNLTPERASAIGQAALQRVSSDHTYERRALQADGTFRRVRERRQEQLSEFPCVS